jgi:hypothetical protein
MKMINYHYVLALVLQGAKEIFDLRFSRVLGRGSGGEQVPKVRRWDLGDVGQGRECQVEVGVFGCGTEEIPYELRVQLVLRAWRGGIPGVRSFGPECYAPGPRRVREKRPVCEMEGGTGFAHGRRGSGRRPRGDDVLLLLLPHRP